MGNILKFNFDLFPEFCKPEGREFWEKVQEEFKQKYGAEKVTIQSRGTLNAIFLRKKLIDKVSIVIAPALIGGKDTSSLIDGESLATFEDLKSIKALKLEKSEVLEDSYLHLTYQVINETEVVD